MMLVLIAMVAILVNSRDICINKFFLDLILCGMLLKLLLKELHLLLHGGVYMPGIDYESLTVVTFIDITQNKTKKIFTFYCINSDAITNHSFIFPSFSPVTISF